MTRYEVKSRLFAMGRASLRISHHTRAIRQYEVELASYPAAPVAAPKSLSEDVYAENDNVLIKEGLSVVLPHGNATSNPTLCAVESRATLQQRINSLVDELDVYSNFYFEMVRRLNDFLPKEQAVLLHTYYCNPSRYTREAMAAREKIGQQAFYKRVRDAISALQLYSLPDIPDELREENKNVVESAEQIFG